VAGTDYWIEIFQQGTRLGAGFLLNQHHALTAFHCVRSAEPGQYLELSLATGEQIPGRVCEHARGADLALIDLLKPRESTLVTPSADIADRGDKWSAPYRPSTGDPYLSGDVLEGKITYRCEAGLHIEALQLGCSERLGDYSGYSGGPVERLVTGREPSLLGILVEQFPDRQAPGRASDVLFAATIAEALRRFNCLGVGHLVNVLYADEQTPWKCRPAGEAQLSDTASPGSRVPVESRITAADSIVETIREWARSGVLDPAQVSELTLRVALRLVDSNWADDA
jgi:Trypsin-like peptidase domain